jgi:VWFA-related protein
MAFAALLVAGIAHAQDRTPTETPVPVIRSNVREVLLDVVVRRKNMSLANKLKASDFTITEDGVPQTIKTFGLTGGGETRVVPANGPATGTGSQSAGAAANSLREPNFVSVVFDAIGPDSRQNALAAANDFLNQEFTGDTYAAIFALNTRMNAVQGFTKDRAALLRAVNTAVRGNSMELATATANVLNQTNYSITGGQGGISINPGVDPTHSPDFATSGASQAPLSESQQALAGMIAAQRPMVSYVAGMRLLTALLQMVEYESRLPGRKTILYLSEGLVKPPDRGDMMRQVIGAANRGNVSFYCIDVRGLTTATSNGMTAGLTATAAGISRGQSSVPTSASGARAQAGEDDLIQEALASHTQLAMAELAEGTGGFAIFSTNDFKRNMTRVMEDVRTHYEISYVPTSTLYDGHFREIKVAVSGKDLTVQSRDGYFAVPDLNGETVLPYEIPGLRVLNGSPRHDFAFHASALRFTPTADGFRYEMSFELDTVSLAFPVDEKTHTGRVHATFLALIKDPRGQIVSKVGTDLDRNVPEDKADQFRRGKIVFTAPFEVAAGRYTIDVAVMDPENDHASTKRIALVVPRPGEPVISTPTVVRDLEPLDGPRDPGNPLEFAGGKIVPTLSRESQAGRDLGLFFVVYPAPSAEKPKVTIEYLQDDKSVSKAQPDPGSPDEVGSLPIISSVRLPAGDYIARVTVDQAGRRTQEIIAVSVKP